MRFLSDLLRSRVLPAIVAALGVSFIAAGLLTYTTGTDADLFPFPSDSTALAPNDSPDPGIIIGDTGDPGDSAAPSTAPSDAPSPAPTTSGSPTASQGPSASPAPSAGGSPIPSATGTINVLPTAIASSLPLPTPSPTGTTAAATPKPTARPVATAKPGAPVVATRIAIPALNIDLPVVRPPGDSTTYPLCNVAMYIQNLSQPGQPGATYIYAHARVGMFLPLLDQSKINNGKGMLGMLVQVYTSDNHYYLYQITEVRRHQLTLADAIAAKDQELWLQTSEGPHGTPGKLQVIAMPLSNGPADPADAHPTPHPVVCG
jgi:sortase (surface protein transpeptidase)